MTVQQRTRSAVLPLYCPPPSAVHPDAAEIGERSLDPMTAVSSQQG